MSAMGGKQTCDLGAQVQVASRAAPMQVRLKSFWWGDLGAADEYRLGVRTHDVRAQDQRSAVNGFLAIEKT
jgi:hypothetical protein